MLEQLLAGADITRVWEGTDLVVRAGDEATVDDLVEQVRATDQPALDPDAEKIVYEVNDWTSDQLGTLTDGLVERGHQLRVRHRGRPGRAGHGRGRGRGRCST